MKTALNSICHLSLSLLLLIVSTSISQGQEGSYNVRDFGAHGDGKSLDTQAIQLAIDQCHKNGGGRVLLYQGEFVSGTIYLKSNVNLHIAPGSILRASNDLEHFPINVSKYKSYRGKHVTNKALIYAEDANRISITGGGTIDGNGDHWVEGPYGYPTFSFRPRIIHMRGCSNITIRDVTLYNSASWVQSYQVCSNLIIDGITVDSRENKDIEQERFAKVRGRNTDGLDLIDCRQVRITNSFIYSGDDGICFKSFDSAGLTSDIIVSNCILSTNASAIKIGTETAGRFQDIVINNCVIFDTRNEGVAILSADGAQIERVTASNISMRNIKGAALAVRLGTRNRPYHDSTRFNTPYIKDILFENIQGTAISMAYGSNFTGTQSFPVENITMRNVNLTYEGGGKVQDAYREIPELDESYPSGRTFGVIPAYALFARHVKGISIDNVTFRYSQEDRRPAVVLDDVTGVDISRLSASVSAEASEMIRAKNVVSIKIEGSRSFGEGNTFLAVYGRKSEELTLINNYFRDFRESFRLKDTEDDIIVVEKNNIK